MGYCAQMVAQVAPQSAPPSAASATSSRREPGGSQVAGSYHHQTAPELSSAAAFAAPKARDGHANSRSFYATSPAALGLEEDFAEPLSDEALCMALAQPGPDGILPLEQAQRLVERTLAVLGPMLGQMCFCAAQPELDFPEIHDLPFAAHISQELLYDPGGGAGRVIDESNADAVLVLAMGTDFTAARETVEALGTVQCTPVVYVLSIVPFFSTEAPLALGPHGYGPVVGTVLSDPCDLASSLELGRSLSDLYATLFERGADDVLCLLGGELVKPHRILECLHRSDFTARKLSELVDLEVSAVQKKVVKKLQMAYKRYLLELAWKVLGNIPNESAELEEVVDENDNLVQLENFEVEAKIGEGSFAKVFKVQHAEYGVAAVKVIPKTSVNNAHCLLSVDREICIMMHLAPHPNVGKALTVVHSKNNFHAVMEYAGVRHLQAFTKEYLTNFGGDALPTELMYRFARHQGAAVQHIHQAMVCHRDLKPTNWVVNDAGDALRLVDFGLAMQVCSRAQPLRHRCGSLPFCAPEVFESPRASEGYDGLAADIWSLGVSFIELSGGPFYTERLIGWIPVHPRERDLISRDLTNLPQLWRERMEDLNTPMCRVIANTMVLNLEVRWRIHQVVGPEGLGQAPSAAAANADSNATPG